MTFWSPNCSIPTSQHCRILAKFCWMFFLLISLSYFIVLQGYLGGKWVSNLCLWKSVGANRHSLLFCILLVSFLVNFSLPWRNVHTFRLINVQIFSALVLRIGNASHWSIQLLNITHFNNFPVQFVPKDAVHFWQVSIKVFQFAILFINLHLSIKAKFDLDV